MESQQAAYSATEAAVAAQVTYRKADYWARIGLVVPTHAPQGSGNVRGYTEADVRTLAAVGRVTAAGLAPSVLTADEACTLGLGGTVRKAGVAIRLHDHPGFVREVRARLVEGSRAVRAT